MILSPSPQLALFDPEPAPWPAPGVALAQHGSLPVCHPEGEAWPDPPGEEAYLGLAGELVATLAPCSEADPVAILAQLLVGVGSICGRGPHYQVGASTHRANEFVVLVGPSGSGRKGSSWDLVEAVLAQVEPSWATEAVMSGLSSGEGLVWHLRDGRPGARDSRLLVLEPELAQVLKAISREANTLSPVLRNAWDGKALQTMTKHDPARASAPHVSVVGHITATELHRHVSGTEAANGFLNRFLFLAVRRARLLPEGGLVDPAPLAPLVCHLARATKGAGRAGRIALDEEARAMWWDTYPTLSASRPGLLGAICARAEAHVVRLALVYAIVGGSSAITVSHLRAALALWDYARRSAAFVFGDSLGDPVADEIDKALSRSPEGLTRTQIRDLFARNRSAAEIAQALHLLTSTGRATRSPAPGGLGRAEVWRTNQVSAPARHPG